MIGRMVRTRSAPLSAKVGARRDQREGEAERGRADADQHGEEQRVPGDAAAQVRGDAVEAPDRVVEEFGDELAEREIAGIVLQARWSGSSRPGRRRRRRSARRRRPIAQTTKASPRHQPRAARPWQSSIRKASRGQRRADAHAGLARARARRTARRASGQLQPLQTDREALQRRCSARPDDAARRPASARPARAVMRADERPGREQRAAATIGSEPPAPSGEHEASGAARPSGAINASQRIEPARPRPRCQGSSAKPIHAEREPACGAAVHPATPCAAARRHGAYFGRFFTSLSHLDSRRRRSADEPYLAKS